MKIPKWALVVLAVAVVYGVLSSQRMGSTCAMKETFQGQCKAMKDCAGGTRTDGPCLMDFA